MSVVGGTLAGEFSQSFRLPASDSQKAFDLLDQRFPARAGSTAMVVLHVSAPMTDPATKQQVQDVLGRIAAVPDVEAVRSPYDADGAQQISPTDPRIAFAEIQFGGTSTDHHVPPATTDANAAIA